MHCMKFAHHKTLMKTMSYSIVKRLSVLFIYQINFWSRISLITSISVWKFIIIIITEHFSQCEHIDVCVYKSISGTNITFFAIANGYCRQTIISTEMEWGGGWRRRFELKNGWNECVGLIWPCINSWHSYAAPNTDLTVFVFFDLLISSLKVLSNHVRKLET